MVFKDHFPTNHPIQALIEEYESQGYFDEYSLITFIIVAGHHEQRSLQDIRRDIEIHIHKCKTIEQMSYILHLAQTRQLS